MTASDVLFDTWAWWEVLFETEIGAHLDEAYVQPSGVRVHTSVLAIGELVAKLWTLGDQPTTETERIEEHQSRGELEAAMVTSILGASELHDLDLETCQAAGRLRTELREAAPDASLADAIMLVKARDLGVPLISNDGAFQDLGDVRDR